MSPPGTFSSTTREPSDAVQADPLLVWSERKQRYYPRKFDHDEARALYAAGTSLADLCKRYGVNDNAIRLAVLPGHAEAEREYNRRWRTTLCESCGGPAMKITGSKAAHNRDGRILCHACRSRVRRKPIRLSADGVVKVECGACKTWKPLTDFPPRVTRALEEGAKVRARCRMCDSAARRDYRETHKVACERCGQPALPPNEKRTHGANRALCVDCFRNRFADRRARELEAASPRKGSEA